MRTIPLTIGLILAFHASAFAQGWTRHAIDNSSRGADGVRLVHDSDGRIEIATAWEEGGEIRLYRQPENDKLREPWPRVTVGRVKSPEDAVLVDLDHDGQRDIVSACEGGTRGLFFHWAPSDATERYTPDAWTTDRVTVVDGKSWMFTLPSDVDGRHGVDLIIGSKNAGAEIGWLAAPERPRETAAWRYHTISPAGWIMSLEETDLEGDGHRDLLVTDRRGPTRGLVRFRFPDDTTQGEWPRDVLATGEREFLFLKQADLAGDGVPEILVAERADGFAIHRRVSTEPLRYTRQSFPVIEGVGNPKAMAAGRLNPAGPMTVLYSCESASDGKSGLVALPVASASDGSFSLGEPVNIAGREGIKYDLVELIDLDRDGDLDVLTCEERAGLGLIWYENPTR
jgi:hypothetical protein